MTQSAQLIPPHGRYLRQLEGGDFSLQANTEQTPQPGRYYVIVAGRVVCESDDFALMDAEYRRYCRRFWEERLRSPNPAVRLSSAWGLLGQDPEHRAARAVILRDGSERDQKRLQQLRHRHYAQQRAAAAASR
ncbi:MAG TPA: hypothetical protein VFU47_09315 [Armatimonadota bacterium]|nr:hypothetical protein [Armatimonadota bacterium]